MILPLCLLPAAAGGELVRDRAGGVPGPARGRPGGDGDCQAARRAVAGDRADRQGGLRRPPARGPARRDRPAHGVVQRHGRSAGGLPGRARARRGGRGAGAAGLGGRPRGAEPAQCHPGLHRLPAPEAPGR